MLIVVSGPDRVGKSTLICRMQEALSGEAYVAHHSAPPKNQQNIFDFYKDDIEEWLSTPQKVAIFDRAWPCSYILEQHRRRNFGHLEDLIDFEIWLNDRVGAVVHLAQFRPWHWSAPLHIEEIREENVEPTAPWYLRDQLVTRMTEHKIYTQQLQEFYEDITLFPNVVLTESTPGDVAIAKCRLALEQAGV
jgi:polyphosphate kinase 2 (PPK2 family)